MESNRFSQGIIVLHGRRAPERGMLVGYGAIISALKATEVKAIEKRYGVIFGEG